MEAQQAHGTTVAKIIEGLEALDSIDLRFQVVHYSEADFEFLAYADGGIRAIAMQGYLDTYSTGFSKGGAKLEFEIIPEAGDTMSPLEIAARIQHWDEPDYNFAKDPVYHPELEEDDA